MSERVCVLCLSDHAGTLCIAGKGSRSVSPKRSDKIDQFVSIFSPVLRATPFYKMLQDLKKEQSYFVLKIGFGLTKAQLKTYLTTRDNKAVAIHWLKRSQHAQDLQFVLAMAAIILNRFVDMAEIFEQGIVFDDQSPETCLLILAFAMAMQRHQQLTTLQEISKELVPSEFVEKAFNKRLKNFESRVPEDRPYFALKAALREIFAPWAKTPSPFPLSGLFQSGGSKTFGQGHDSKDRTLRRRMNKTLQTTLSSLIVAPSSIPNAGNGVWTNEDIPMNNIITVFGGEVIDNVREVTENTPPEEKQWMRSLTTGTNATAVDGRVHGPYTLPWYIQHHYLGSFVNENRESAPNSAFVNIEPGKDKGMPLRFMNFQMHSPVDPEGQSAPSVVVLMALRPIAAGEELFVDYGDYDRTAYGV